MKKILALALTLVLAFGMMVPVSAAGIEINGLNLLASGFDKYETWTQDCEPGDVFVMEDVTLEIFTFSEDPLAYFAGLSNDAARLSATKKLLKNVNFRVRHRIGTKVLDSVSIENITWDSNAQMGVFDIEFECVDPFVSVDTVDYEIDVYFEINGRTDNEWFMNISGEFGNQVTEVYADSVEADSWEGQVIEATEYVGKIVLVGNEDEDVLAHIKMANGKKIYFVVNTDGDAKDEPIMDKYPSIEFAYTVLSVGLSSTSGNFIELAGVDEAYYIYGKNADGTLKYLGRGGELLPYSAKYYVSSQKLELDEDVVEELPEEEEVPGPTYNPSTGI